MDEMKSKVDSEFEAKCMKEKKVTIAPTVTIIKQEKIIQSLANQHKRNSEYFLEGAKSLLNSDTSLLAILIGYFAMEHKANQVIALHGYKVESHICTQMALSRVIGRKDLARTLSEVFEKRQTIGYRMFLDGEKQNANLVITEIIVPFIEEIENMIDSL